jgi:hypothetical protein
LLGFAIGDLSGKFLQKYHKKWNAKFRTTFFVCQQTSNLLYYFPVLFDAICLAIKKNGAKYLKVWAMVSGFIKISVDEIRL